MALYTAWEILLAWIPNSDGTPPPYKHRCIYLCDSTKLAGGILVIGITSDANQFEPGYSIALPYADQPGGDPVTHLVKPSFAQAKWHEHIMPAVVTDVVGYVPVGLQGSIRECLARRIQDIKAEKLANQSRPPSIE